MAADRIVAVQAKAAEGPPVCQKTRGRKAPARAEGAERHSPFLFSS